MGWDCLALIRRMMSNSLGNCPGSGPEKCNLVPMAIPTNVRNQYVLLCSNTVPMENEILNHDLNFGFHRRSRTISQIEKLFVIRLVVVLLRFLARVLKVLNLDVKSKFLRHSLNLECEVTYLVEFLELIKHAIFPCLCGILENQGQALHGISQRKKAPSLTAFAKRCERMANDRLTAKAVDDRAKRLIKIDAGEQSGVLFHPVDSRTKHHALHDVAGAQVPNLAGEHNVVRAVYFRPVIPRARGTGERKSCAPSSKIQFKESFGNIHVGRSVFTHGAKFDQVRAWPKVSHGIQQIEGRRYVIRLNEYRMVDINHGVRRRRTFSKMHDALRLKLLKDALDELIVAQISFPKLQAFSVSLPKGGKPILHGGNRCRAPRSHFFHPVAAKKEISARNLMTAPGQMLRQSPTKVTVNACNENSHLPPSSR